MGELPHLAHIMDPQSDAFRSKGKSISKGLLPITSVASFFPRTLRIGSLPLRHGAERAAHPSFLSSPQQPVYASVFHGCVGNGDLLPKNAPGARRGVKVLYAPMNIWECFRSKNARWHCGSLGTHGHDQSNPWAACREIPGSRSPCAGYS